MLKRTIKKNEIKNKKIMVGVQNEVYATAMWEKESLPVVAILNAALKGFEPKEDFGWHLSLTINKGGQYNVY